MAIEQTVLLKRPHSHNGSRHAAGASIAVAAHHIPWLIEQGVIDTPAISNTASAMSALEPLENDNDD